MWPSWPPFNRKVIGDSFPFNNANSLDQTGEIRTVVQILMRGNQAARWFPPSTYVNFGTKWKVCRILERRETVDILHAKHSTT